jgi:hypothetical protein
MRGRAKAISTPSTTTIAEGMILIYLGGRFWESASEFFIGLQCVHSVSLVVRPELW